MTAIISDTADILLYTGADWSYDKLRRTYDAIEHIAVNEFGLNPYPNQVEIITAEQMLDAYSSVGMPLMYRHWSYGKHFVRDETMYRKGYRGLAYEIVINSNPCISYIMEENTMTMQALVMAHAAFGHNHFFRNNQLFLQWTDANGILPYMEFAKNYINHCEERYGLAAVERVLDAAHALMGQGVHRHPKKRMTNLAEEEKRERDRQEYADQTFNDLWRTLPKPTGGKAAFDDTAARRALLGLPEENILYFLEKKAPKLQHWEREILRIVRHVSQYFYPQKQTKVMNEGCASYVHYMIMNRLHDTGRIDDGAMLEFLHSHTSVVFQPDFDDPRYSGINPYALGFAMMEDIARIATEPDEEDYEWFPHLAGTGDPWGALRDAWADFRDESFILQYLSPRLIRKFRLFSINDAAVNPVMVIDKIHNERGYRDLRRKLARQYDLAYHEPDIQVVDVDLAGDRRLILQHRVMNNVLLEEGEARAVLRHLAELWGYEVVLREVSAANEMLLKEHPPVGPAAKKP